VLGDVAVDRGLQVDDRGEAAALEPAPGQGREEGLDRVQPGARRWGARPPPDVTNAVLRRKLELLLQRIGEINAC
jgi:hypothetical protein